MVFFDGFAHLGNAATCALRRQEHPFRGVMRNYAKCLGARWGAQVKDNGQRVKTPGRFRTPAEAAAYHDYVQKDLGREEACNEPSAWEKWRSGGYGYGEDQISAYTRLDVTKLGYVSKAKR